MATTKILGQEINALSAITASFAIAVAGIDTQLFTGSGVWTKPANAKYVEIYLVGGAGGGASGRRGLTSTARYGGGGGSSGAFNIAKINASNLAATENIWIGAGGTSGPARAINDTNGAPGGTGAVSIFGGSGTTANAKLTTANGFGGSGGTAASQATSTIGNSVIFGVFYNTSIFGTGMVASNNFSGGVLNYTSRPLTAGGLGGGLSAANAQNVGGGLSIKGPSSGQTIATVKGWFNAYGNKDNTHLHLERYVGGAAQDPTGFLNSILQQKQNAQRQASIAPVKTSIDIESIQQDTSYTVVHDVNNIVMPLIPA